ncbi:FAD-dependent oxidoreductase [Streptacidiphilus pinicola]|uniref:FAD-dependent oxidoreductase n=1 Tax=Streptacidiphilus pinicola TaxID=2219663 RepID=A0A2X0JDK2_9ACTN|nr:FAD-dependent monooxygenase [Streptacidiphilus pinicola]RAG85718.1 FAD-dependent oxidoreductase [Streptacidiphilus pinicola]
MNTTQNRDYDVLVVGAGPTGLLLAGDVAAAGLRVALLERRTEESKLTRAFAVHARSLEELDARGLADDLLRTGARLSSLSIFGAVRVDMSKLPSRFPELLITPQYQTERALLRRALAAGAELFRGTEVTDLRQGEDGVEVDALLDGGTTTFRASYVVGSDGVRSTVRRLLGVDYPGESAISSVMLADVRLDSPPEDVLAVGASKQGFAFMAPYGDGWYRVIAWDHAEQLPDSAPVDFDAMCRLVTSVLGKDYGLHDPRWTSRFHSDERQATTYRVGRVFLAGDAAHCHSPAGGQGMNTGLQDAANLGWKLVAAVRGWAAPGLLDSYQAERHPVGAHVLKTSGGLLRVSIGQSAPLRLARALAKTFGAHLAPLARRGGMDVSGIAVSYHAQAPAGSHRLVGKRAVDVDLTHDADGKAPTRLYEALREGRFVLVAPEGARVGDGFPADWSDRVVTTTAPGADWLLVRPDGYVAWAAEHPTPQAVTTGLAAWLGR